MWEESACKVIVLFCILETFKDRQSTLAGLENVSKQCNSSATCSHSVQCFHDASQRAISSELFMLLFLDIINTQISIRAMLSAAR